VLTPAIAATGEDPEWLAKEVSKSAGKSADEIAERLAQAAIKRHGGEARDDSPSGCCTRRRR